MKILKKIFIIIPIFAIACNIHAEEDKTAEYLQNFATHFNIDVNKKQKIPIPTPAFEFLEGIGEFLTKNALIKGKIANSSSAQGGLEQLNANPMLDQKPYANDPTLQAVYNMLTMPPTENDCLGQSNCLYKDKFLDNFYKFTGISQPYYINQRNIITAPSDELNLNNQSLSLTGLLNPLNYSISPPQEQQTGRSGGSSRREAEQKFDQQNIANNFVKLISGQANPLTLPRSTIYRNMIGGANGVTNAESKKNLQNYLNRLYNYIALSSVSISNFNEMLARRIPNPKLGNLSLAQVEHQMNTRRLGGVLNPNDDNGASWHEEMEKASPAVVQRETLYILAEMNYNLHQSRLQNERILATLSAMHSQNLEMVKDGIRLN